LIVDTRASPPLHILIYGRIKARTSGDGTAIKVVDDAPPFHGVDARAAAAGAVQR